MPSPTTSAAPTSSQRALRRWMRRPLGAKVRSRQIISVPTKTSQGGDEPGNVAGVGDAGEGDVGGQEAEERPGRRRHADEVGLSDDRRVAVDVEAREPEAGTDREDEGRRPREVGGAGERHLVDEHRRDDAEADEVRERVRARSRSGSRR